MKLNTFLGLAFAISTGIAQAQTDVQITWGDYIPLAKGHKPAGFAGNSSAGYVQFGEDIGKSVSLNKISATLKPGGTDVKDLKAYKKVMLESVVQLGDKAYVMVSGNDKESGNLFLMAFPVDIKSGKFVGEGQKIAEDSGELEGRIAIVAGVGYVTYDRFKFATSEDGTRLLVYYTQRPTRQTKEQDHHFYKLFDADLKELWTFESPNYTGLSGNIRVQESGLSVVGCYNGLSGYAQVGIVTYKGGNEKTERVEIPLEKISVQNFTTYNISDSKVLVAGYYSGTAKAVNSTGYFTVLVDVANGTVGAVNKYPFKDELINAFESDRTKRKLEKEIEKGAEPGIPFLQMTQVVKRADGGYYLIGEQFHFKVVNTNDGSKTYYYFQDAIVSVIDANGEAEGVVKIPKNQKFVNSTYGSSVGAFEFKSNLYLFYLDNTANKNLAEGAVPVEFRDFRDGSFMCVKITPDAKVKRTALFEMADENKTILPDGIEQVEPGLLMSSGRRSQIMSGKVNMPALIRLN